MRLGGALSIAIALVAFACSDSLTPAAVVGTYTLVSIDGNEPPLVLGGASGCTLLLVGGRLELRPAPDWSDLALARAQDCRPVDGGVTTDTLRYLGRYWLDGATLTFETQLSLEDTLRFSGPVWLGGVMLAMRDTIRGVGEHRLAFF